MSYLWNHKRIHYWVMIPLGLIVLTIAIYTLITYP